MALLSNLPDDLYERLESLPYIFAQGYEYLPCRVRLADGRVVDDTYIRMKRGKYIEAAPESYNPDLLGYKWNAPEPGWNRYLSMEEIVSIEPSPCCLPTEIVKKITGPASYLEREYRCMLLLKDGRRLPYIAPLVDFPDLPEGVTVADVVDALPYDYKSPHSRICGARKFSYAYFDAHRERYVRDPRVLEALHVPSHLVEDLRRIEATEGGSRPCRLTMRDGAVKEHVSAFPADWRNFDADTAYLWMKDVAKIERSPDRVPTFAAKKIWASGPVGKGAGYDFAVVFRDGRKLHFELRCYSEFLTLPAGYAHSEIVDVIPFERSEGETSFQPEIFLCPYLI